MKDYLKFTGLCASMACMVLMGTAFVSCSDDDDDGGSPSSALPSVSEIGISDPVVAIDSYGDIARFNYTKGVMTGGTSISDGDATFTIGGSPLRISIVEDDGDGWVYRQQISNIKLNSHGAMTSAKGTITEEYDNEVDYVSNGTITVEYDGNRIKKLVATETCKEGEYNYASTTTINFRWSGNNLIEINSTYVENDGDETYTNNSALDFTYSADSETNNGIVPPEMLIGYEFLNYSGLLGRITESIPASYTYSEDDGDYVYTGDYTVTKDDKGRIEQLYEDGYLQETYYYSDTYGSMGRAVKKAMSNDTRRKPFRLFGKRHLRR